MSLKTASVPNRQNVGWAASKSFADTVKTLKEENALVVRGEKAKQRVVKIIDGFVAKLARNEKQAARVALCQKAGIVLRTFERWKAEIEQREEIGSSVYEAAEKLGYEITPSSIRSLADTKRLNPDKTPEEIVRKALDPQRQLPAERVPLDTRESLVQALNQHLEATGGDTESVIKILRSSPIRREQICKMCKEASTDVE